MRERCVSENGIHMWIFVGGECVLGHNKMGKWISRTAKWLEQPPNGIECIERTCGFITRENGGKKFKWRRKKAPELRNPNVLMVVVIQNEKKILFHIRDE